MYPRFLNLCRAYFMYDFVRSVRRLQDVFVPSLFLGSTFALFGLTFQAPLSFQNMGGSSLSVGVILGLCVLAQNLSTTHAFDESIKQGIWESLLKTSLAPEWIIFLKIWIHWSKSLIPVLLTLPLSLIFFPVEDVLIGRFLMSVVVGFVPLVSLGLVAAALSLHTSYSFVLGLFLIVPFQVPILIFMIGFVQSGSWIPLGGVIGLSFLHLPATCYVCGHLLKKSISYV